MNRFVLWAVGKTGKKPRYCYSEGQWILVLDRRWMVGAYIFGPTALALCFCLSVVVVLFK